MKAKKKKRDRGGKKKKNNNEILIENSFQYSAALLIMPVQGFGIDPVEGSLLSTFLTDGA